jgi:hypothetical protein
MSYSIELARFLGLFISIISLGLLINRKHFLEVADNLVVSPSVQLVATILPLILGSFIIVTHNIWNSDWTVLVTIVGWLIFLAGVFRAFFPAAWINIIKTKSHGAFPAVMGVIFFIIGLILLWFGFLSGNM